MFTARPLRGLPSDYLLTETKGTAACIVQTKLQSTVPQKSKSGLCIFTVQSLESCTCAVKGRPKNIRQCLFFSSAIGNRYSFLFSLSITFEHWEILCCVSHTKMISVSCNFSLRKPALCYLPFQWSAISSCITDWNCLFQVINTKCVILAESIVF